METLLAHARNRRHRRSRGAGVYAKGRAGQVGLLATAEAAPQVTTELATRSARNRSGTATKRVLQVASNHKEGRKTKKWKKTGFPTQKDSCSVRGWMDHTQPFSWDEAD
eukprot:4427759-Amphidinium_carterae.1